MRRNAATGIFEKKNRTLKVNNWLPKQLCSNAQFSRIRLHASTPSSRVIKKPRVYYVYTRMLYLCVCARVKRSCPVINEPSGEKSVYTRIQNTTRRPHLRRGRPTQRRCLSTGVDEHEQHTYTQHIRFHLHIHSPKTTDRNQLKFVICFEMYFLCACARRRAAVERSALVWHVLFVVYERVQTRECCINATVAFRTVHMCITYTQPNSTHPGCIFMNET